MDWKTYALVSRETSDGTNEKTWGYGQITPLLFLLLPVLNAVSIYSEDYEAQRRSSADPRTNYIFQTENTQAPVASTSSSNMGTESIRRRDTEARIGEHIEMSDTPSLRTTPPISEDRSR
ncbi:hypothetical protein DL98DRAFT_516339 [Cadophora sp. DSE1049]|nr:hypothetical protein DL98DRAFT_516339 [Cadophora sp. DSE1049]